MYKEKIIGISFTRMLALIMVIMLHVLNSTVDHLGIVVLQGGVALYVIISAILMAESKQSNMLLILIKKFVRVLKPYWIWILCVFVIYYFIGYDYSFANIKTMMLLGQNHGTYNQFVLTGFGHLWYIPFVLGCYLLTPILYNFFEEIKKWSENNFLLFIFAFCAIFFWIGMYWNYIGPGSCIQYYLLYSVCYLCWKYYSLKNQFFLNAKTRVVIWGG